MSDHRRWIRIFVGQLMGVQGDLQIWWTPEIPIVYIANQKSGCSTIKQSLKAAQAHAYARSGTSFNRKGHPHSRDDCLRRDGLAPAECRQRYVISCVRNPFVRALSGYLDKIDRPDPMDLPEMRGQKIDSFEDYLLALSNYKPALINAHFRPQHINLDYPRIKYDAIFFLESLTALSRFLTRIHPDFELETFAPHARDAGAKLRQHYTEKAIDLVRTLYAEDFAHFGYSHDIEEAGAAPGEMITADGLVPADAELGDFPSHPRHAEPGSAFETTLRYRRLVAMNLI